MAEKISNRFKKSIEIATDNTQENILHDTVGIAGEKKSEYTVDIITENILDNIQTNISFNTSNNILDDILKSSKKDRGKNYTIYLSADVADALDNQAKQSGMSKSELVDKILRKVLIG